MAWAAIRTNIICDVYQNQTDLGMRQEMEIQFFVYEHVEFIFFIALYSI